MKSILNQREKMMKLKITENIEVKSEVQQKRKKSKHLKHLQHLNSLKGNKSRTKLEMKILLNQKGEMTTQNNLEEKIEAPETPV